MQLSRPLFDRLKAIPMADADAETRHVLARRLGGFDRAGVSRDHATRTRIAAYNAGITALEIGFAENIANGRATVSAEVGELEGLPADYLAAHQPGVG